MNKKFLNSADSITRRGFIGNIAKTTLGVTFGASAVQAASKLPHNVGTAKKVIYLYMSGGMSQHDTISPKEANDTVTSNFDLINTSADGIQFSNVLPGLAKQAHHMAIIESMNSTQGAHQQGTYYMHTNYTERGTIRHPGVSSWVANFLEPVNRSLPASVIVGSGSARYGSGFMSKKYNPLPVANADSGLQNIERPGLVREKEYQKRLALLDIMNKGFANKYGNVETKAYEQAYDDAVSIMKSTELTAFDLNEESGAMRDFYGRSSFGQGCLLARRLIEADVRFVEVMHGGWDSHENNTESVKNRSKDLDEGMSALLADLSARGLLDDTLVVLATEFGRTPTYNVNAGRDHYPRAFSCALAGGGVRGGQIYGKTDAVGKSIVDKKVTVKDFNATIGHALGIDTTKTIHSPGGRPFTMGNKGTPIDIF